VTICDAQPLVGIRDYAALEADFRSHHQQNPMTHSGSYDQYRPVYRYGYDLGTDTRYHIVEWTSVEQTARPHWEERNPGTWEQFKDTIRYAWDKARGGAEGLTG
jgi:hypothetical protein